MLAETNGHPLDALVPDPAGEPPMGDEEFFSAVVSAMVAANAPRVFAVAQEYGTRVDARIAAWGLAFDDHADVIDSEGTAHLAMPSPEFAVQVFGVGSRITPRLVWVDPDAVVPPLPSAEFAGGDALKGAGAED